MPECAVGGPRVWSTPTGAWLIYETEDAEDPDDAVQRSAVFITPAIGGVLTI
ncbi:hypothetical protein IWX63_000455 [Arthrobacter sp. CAN_A2]|uniref:hypothetical protein n=1 Tax=Arthrobacter sp. CAN_A2 TaxID=2787718 RepID=UPI0018F02EAF